VAESESVCVLHPDHPLAEKDIITLDDISNEPQIVLEREYTSTKTGSLTPAKIYSDTIGLDASFVANGMGIMVDNRFIARQYQMFDLKIVPFQPAATYHYVVFWRRSSDKLSCQSPVVQTFVDVIKREQSLREERAG
ncbi:LysR substrate-binding domain-containing protein, partial [Mesorhizobium sp.]|uniref:LysR substrate-binding domain-containing protein n=1 Tax=Mesorhizobium sp. TaxID=1871066 RepID=UPI0011F9E9B4